MGDPIEEDRKQESLNQLKTQISSMLDDEQDPYIDFQLYDVDTYDIHNYLRKIYFDQDLPSKLFKVGYMDVSDMEAYNTLCDYCMVYKAPFSALIQQKVYFIETADNAVTVIPIQLAKNEVNISIELLENSPKFIKDMYMKMGKLKMEDIKFVKFNKQ